MRTVNSPYIDRMDTVNAAASVGKITDQRFFHGFEGQLVPGDFGLGKKPSLNRFVTGFELVTEQAGAVKQMHLTDTRNIEHTEEILHFKLRTCLFVGLACCAL